MRGLRDIRNYTSQVLPGRSNLAHAITGFLFAVHPIHSEAVAGIVGRADLLACFLTLISFLTYSGHCNRARSPFPLLLALTSSTLATLAKETGISSLALCLLWELCRGEPARKVSDVTLISFSVGARGIELLTLSFPTSRPLRCRNHLKSHASSRKLTIQIPALDNRDNLDGSPGGIGTSFNYPSAFKRGGHRRRLKVSWNF
jgi:hypothetical protein